MITWPLLAAFLSGFAWSGLDIARKSLARNISLSVIATALSMALAVLFGSWSLATTPSLDPAAYLLPAAIATTLSLAVQLAILAAVRVGELSRTVPLLSLTPVATALFGVAVLGEHPEPRQWLGIVLVFVGALGLGLSRYPEEHPEAGTLRLHFDRGMLYMLVAALCISAAAPFDKLAVTASSPALHGFVQSVLTVIVLVTYLGWRGDLAGLTRAFRSRPALSIAGVVAFAALGLQFLAYQGVMVGVVETIKRVVGMVASVVAGRLIFGENLTAKKLLTIVLMAAGVILLLS